MQSTAVCSPAPKLSDANHGLELPSSSNAHGQSAPRSSNGTTLILDSALCKVSKAVSCLEARLVSRDIASKVFFTTIHRHVEIDDVLLADSTSAPRSG